MILGIAKIDLFLLIVLATIACSTVKASEVAPGEPEKLADGWPVSTLQSECFSVDQMDELYEFIRNDSNNDFKGLLVARNGKLVYEGYFNGHNRALLHDIRSATKSLTSSLVGIAIAENLIGGVETSIVSQLSMNGLDFQDEEQKQEITIEHLLTMASGLNADDSDPVSAGNENRLYASDDWVEFALALPMSNSPGETWVYASVNTFLLGLVVEEAADRLLSSYAETELFEPLGIAEYTWASTPLGRTVAQGNLSLRLRDMAKFGQLYLDQGRWAGTQIVPEAWVDASIVARYSVPWNGYDEYGYGWYRHRITVMGREYDYYLASGNGGNKIYVFPEERMLVVIQSAAYNTSYGQRRSLDVLGQVLDAFRAEDR